MSLHIELKRNCPIEFEKTYFCDKRKSKISKSFNKINRMSNKGGW